MQKFECKPPSVQRPHPPFYLGGGGRRMLSIAAREASTVGIHFNLRAGDFTDQTMRSQSTDQTAEKIQWVREAAGTRFEQLELGIMVLCWQSPTTIARPQKTPAAVSDSPWKK